MSKKLEFEARKDPEGVRFYSFNWEEWLAEGETITDKSVTKIDPSTNLVIAAPQVDGTRVKFAVSSGDEGAYELRCKITTSEGQVHPVTATLHVKGQ